jgi:hypothetical protein
MPITISGDSPNFTSATLTTPTLTSPTFAGTMSGSVITSGTVNGGAANPLSGGTSVDFTGIPSWVKRITIMFNGVSTSGTSNIQIQLGDSGGVETTGYNSGAGYGVSGGQFASSTTGLILDASASATSLRYGSMIISLLGSNTWTEQCCTYSTITTTNTSGGGAKTLSDVLDRVRITTVNGTDTFDAGTINILYE